MSVNLIVNSRRKFNLTASFGENQNTIISGFIMQDDLLSGPSLKKRQNYECRSGKSLIANHNTEIQLCAPCVILLKESSIWTGYYSLLRLEMYVLYRCCGSIGTWSLSFWSLFHHVEICQTLFKVKLTICICLTDWLIDRKLVFQKNLYIWILDCYWAF